jgi:hypothetical protein
MPCNLVEDSRGPSRLDLQLKRKHVDAYLQKEGRHSAVSEQKKVAYLTLSVAAIHL